MRRPALAALLAFLALLALAACGGEGGDSSGNSPAVILEGTDRTTTVPVEVADTTEERARGLSGRETLAADAGMLFLFDEPVTQGFWMKDTLIPLSIAFIDGNGRIIALRDMEPCRREPCPLYEPGRPYSSALEVNQGAFDRWGIGEGDRASLSGGATQD
jgi:uncharacterized membrane protein (UPF0127 family)